MASKVFKMLINSKEEAFDYGTIVIPSGIQSIGGEALESVIKEAIAETGVDAYALPSGFAADGIDIGSNSFVHFLCLIQYIHLS